MNAAELLHEQDLERRLREAEDTLAGLLTGTNFPDREARTQENVRLRGIIDGLGPSVFVGLLTPAGILIEANRSALEAAGLEPADVLGRPFADTPWWAHSRAVQEQLRAAIVRAAAGVGSRYDVVIRGAGGELIEIDFSLEPLRDEAGDVVSLVPSGIVITERKRVENELRESDAKFNQLAASVTDVFWIRSADMSELHYISPAFERIWGRSADSLRANPAGWVEAIVPGDRERVRQAYVDLARDTRSIDVEYGITRPDGEVRWVRTRGYQVRDDADRLIRLVGIVTDVTERRRVQTALQESEGRYRTLAESMPQIVWVARADGFNVYINQQWMDYTGLTLDQSLGDGWSAAFHPDDRELSRDSWRTAVATKQPHVIECRLRRADGVYRWWLIRGVPILDADGAILKWFGTCTDIHDLKRAQLEIERVNRALKMLGECGEVLVRAESEAQLLDQICRIAVESGGYRMAWVGYARGDDGTSVTQMAHAGEAAAFLAYLRGAHDDPSGAGSGSVASDPGAVCANAADCFFTPWLAGARRHGYQGIVCLPLRDATRTFGVLVLYSGEVAETSAEEIGLLEQVADDVVFGIGKLRVESERARLQAAVVKVAAGVSAATGTKFFEQLARNMAEALGAQAAFVARILPGELAKAHVLAALVEGRSESDFEYVIEGTPCDALLTTDACVIARQVAARFPAFPFLKELAAEGFVGQALDSSSGERLGFLFVIFGERLEDVDFITSTLRIFAARAAAELERQHTDAQLREQAALLDIAHEAILVKDLDGRVMYWNKGAERIYGWSSEEMIGRDSVATLYKDVAHFQVARRALLENGEWQGEVINRTKDGRDMNVDVRWTLVRDAEGCPRSILAIHEDITEKRSLRSQLMVSDRMASVGTLAAGVAHEINNPLAAVIANLDYIDESLSRSVTADDARERGGALLAADLRGPLTDAREAAQRVRLIVRDLKVLSRAPGDDPTTPVDVSAMLETTLRMAGNEVRHRARVVKSYGAVPAVEANEARLGQVFLNLIVNAAQALPEGRAEHNEIRVTTRLQGERVIIEVADTGVGIAPDMIDRVFDAFYTTKEIGTGMGLGLAISHRIVSDMGGTLTVQSELGRGTTFRVALPAAHTEKGGMAARDLPLRGPELSGRGRVLVVDDDELVLRGVRRILDREHEVTTLASARAALALCASGERFDLILCDLMMPDMTGMDLHRELTALVPEQAGRMIFFTGGAFTARARSFLAESSREHLAKPFDPHDLREIVLRHLRTDGAGTP